MLIVINECIVFQISFVYSAMLMHTYPVLLRTYLCIICAFAVLPTMECDIYVYFMGLSSIVIDISSVYSVLLIHAV